MRWTGLALITIAAALPLYGAEEDAAAIYKRQCASCHGADGSGKTGPGKAFKLRDLTSREVQQLTDQQLFDIIANGKGKMPAYSKSLGHDKIHAQVKHIREMAKQKK